MIFDGAKLYFEDQVEMESRGQNKEGKPVVVSSASAGLSLKFNRTIQFQDLQNDSPTGDIDIQETVIVDRLPKINACSNWQKPGRTTRKLRIDRAGNDHQSDIST